MTVAQDNGKMDLLLGSNRISIRICTEFWIDTLISGFTLELNRIEKTVHKEQENYHCLI